MRPGCRAKRASSCAAGITLDVHTCALDLFQRQDSPTRIISSDLSRQRLDGRSPHALPLLYEVLVPESKIVKITNQHAGRPTMKPSNISHPTPTTQKQQTRIYNLNPPHTHILLAAPPLSVGMTVFVKLRFGNSTFWLGRQGVFRRLPRSLQPELVLPVRGCAVA